MILKVADAVPEFLDYMTGRGLSPGTVRRHGVAARGFARACQKVKGRDATMGQVDHACIARYFQDMTGSTGYRNNNLETLRHFLNWAEKWGYLRHNFTAAQLVEGYKVRKAERQPKHFLDREEFPAALEAAGRRNPSDRAVVALALYTLARASEIAPARLCDIDLAKGELRLYREKKDRWTVTGMTPELVAEMQAWLQCYAAEMGYLSPHTMAREHPDWLLVPSRGRGHAKLQPTQPICVMERVAKRALTDLGVTTTRQGRSTDHLGEGMHTFRRSGARAFLKALTEGLGHQRALMQVALMLDHEGGITPTLLRYLGVDQEKDELNNWLKGNSMYGRLPESVEAAVLTFRRPEYIRRTG